jgi:hypothetical protein
VIKVARRKKPKKIPIKQTRKKEGECFICGATEDLQEHHIIPKCIGGRNLKENKRLLCPRCHKKVHQLIDPIVIYLGRAIQLLNQDLEQERHGGLQAPIGFRPSKRGKKNENNKRKSN